MDENNFEPNYNVCILFYFNELINEFLYIKNVFLHNKKTKYSV
jgi:hypothetical protein